MKYLLVESRIRENLKICLWNQESWALESGIQLEESGVLLKIGIQNLSSIDKDWNQEGVLDSLPWGDNLF